MLRKGAGWDEEEKKKERKDRLLRNWSNIREKVYSMLKIKKTWLQKN